MVTMMLGLLLGTALAQEVDVERAKVLYSNGKMLFEEKEFGKAIELGRWLGNSAVKQAILLYNIALAYEEMGITTKPSTISINIGCMHRQKSKMV